MAEEIRTAAELDALPVGSVLVHPLDPAWTLTRGAYIDGLPWGGSDGERWSSEGAALNGFMLLHRPDAPQPTPVGDDAVERAHAAGLAEFLRRSDEGIASSPREHVLAVVDAALAAARAGEVETVPVLTDEEWATPDDAPGLRAMVEKRRAAQRAAQRGGEVADREALVGLLMRVGHVEWDRADAFGVADHLLDFLAARGEAAPSVSAERREAVRAVLARQMVDPVSPDTLTDRVLTAIGVRP